MGHRKKPPVQGTSNIFHQDTHERQSRQNFPRSDIDKMSWERSKSHSPIAGLQSLSSFTPHHKPGGMSQPSKFFFVNQTQGMACQIRTIIIMLKNTLTSKCMWDKLKLLDTFSTIQVLPPKINTLDIQMIEEENVKPQHQKTINYFINFGLRISIKYIVQSSHRDR